MKRKGPNRKTTQLGLVLRYNLRRRENDWTFLANPLSVFNFPVLLFTPPTPNQP